MDLVDVDVGVDERDPLQVFVLEKILPSNSYHCTNVYIDEIVNIC